MVKAVDGCLRSSPEPLDFGSRRVQSYEGLEKLLSGETKKCLIINRKNVFRQESVNEYSVVDDKRWSVLLNGEYSYWESENEDSCKSFLVVIMNYGYCIVKTTYRRAYTDYGKDAIGVVTKWPICKIRTVLGKTIIRNGKESYKNKDERFNVKDLMEKRVMRYVEMKCKVDQDFVPGDVTCEKIELPIAVEDTVDEESYLRYASIMDMGGDVNPEGKTLSGVATLKMQDVSAKQVYQIFRAWKGEIGMKWEDIDGGYSYAAKPAALKKDGTRRIVYPMSPKLNAFLTQTMPTPRLNVPANVKIIKSVDEWENFRYSYDVESCDRVGLPYFKRYIREKYPLSYDKIFCKVIINGESKELTTFPSGICKFMGVQSAAYTIARYNLGSYDCDVQVQGDGFAMDLPCVDLEGLRPFPKRIINGFKINKIRDWNYVNGMAKLTTPILLRGKGKLRGVQLWEFRRSIYKNVLRCKDLPEVRNFRHHREFEKMDLKEMMAFCRAYDDDLYRLLSFGVGCGEGRGACSFGGWDNNGYVGV